MGSFNFELLKEKWPSAIVARQEVKQFSGGVLSSKSMANLDSKKQGPPGSFRIGRKICYPVDSLIEWMEGRSDITKERR